MTTTYSLQVFERINHFRSDTVFQATENHAMLERTDMLLQPQKDADYTPGDSIEAFIISNLDAAANFQAAVLRMIPSLVEIAQAQGKIPGNLSLEQRIALYQSIAGVSEPFIRDMSMIPAPISQFIGEKLFEEGTPGLWDSILLAASAQFFRSYFTLSESENGLRVDFSASMKSTLAKKAADLQGVEIDERTGLPRVTAKNWFGCPGIQNADGTQVNIDMWRQHVALTPMLYALQAA